MRNDDLKYHGSVVHNCCLWKAGESLAAVCALLPFPAFGGLEPLLSLLCLSREEAKEMWEKREAEWAREQSARDRLMSEVIPAVGSTGHAGLPCSESESALLILGST